jgi:hypothetical protein
MANCLLSSGWKIGCNKLRSGIRNIYVLKSDYVTGYSINSDTDVITNIYTQSSRPYYSLEIKSQTGEFGEKLVYDEKTGAEYWDQVLVLPLLKSSYLLRNLVIQLLNDKYSIIIRDENGRYWLLGKDFFCKVKDAEGTRGKIAKDFNGTKITFLSREGLPAYEVESTAFTISSDVTTGAGGTIDVIHQ